MTGKKTEARSAARLAAVQALYQMDMTGVDASDVITEFGTARLQENEEPFIEFDADYFRDLLTGIIRQQKQIDPPIHDALRDDWPLSRLDSTLRAILRAGVYELMYRKDVPFKAIINEYMEIAHAFFDGGEPAMVNGVLDHLAKISRTSEKTGH